MLSLKRNGAPFLWNGCAVLAEYAGGILLRVLDVQRSITILQKQGIKAVTAEHQPDVLQLPPLSDQVLAALVSVLAQSGAGVVGVTSQTKNLEEIFLSLTQDRGEVA